MHIAVGFLHTDEGRAAFEAAASEALLRDATLIVVHSMKGGERDEQEIAFDHDRALRDAEADLAERGVTYEVKRYARGKTPSEDLLRTAKDLDVDLLVIGIRRRSPVGKLLLGSNAQDIILHADCPVLAVKP
ncbi:MAG TPA: universal stress protein [Nitriliruptoraceae bacterium]|nr:universal stress protein [Nitriliruptoraceae bacterium]